MDKAGCGKQYGNLVALPLQGQAELAETGGMLADSDVKKSIAQNRTEDRRRF